MHNITFHTSGSFNDIWDKDDDGSVIDHAPTFWGNCSAAVSAGDAVIAKLGSEDTWNSFSDLALKPMVYLALG